MNFPEAFALCLLFGALFAGMGYVWGWDDGNTEGWNDCKRKILPPRANNGQFMKREDL